MAMVMVAMMMMAMITIATAKHQLVVDGAAEVYKNQTLETGSPLKPNKQKLQIYDTPFLVILSKLVLMSRLLCSDCRHCIH